MSWLRKKRVLLALCAALLALLFINSSWIGRLMYPIRYSEDITVSAENNDVDPYLVAAIIRTETNFRTGKVSSKGALGIMQIMPETAQWIIERAEFSNVSLDDIRERADVGIELGAWYLHSLYKQFGGNPVAAVAAYNAGPGNVRGWLNKGVWDGRSETSDTIPFGETRHYVQRVMYYYNKYKTIYPTL
ncbi:lytic transglycosylase [Paenibacillus darwinianus]|uniref:Lytic transglycosylase n=1 Tax=Paenibacillus darwinianus TaxID=1380763 RepID=A0A9W5S3G3_9BACL|nr:lytic transglycosylase domain-containing protein [Paenibacillus darwinianus]EXX89526.1 lytic transglycosylase [Paenibacillus darwinianus]EXX90695.1 lytic transglycosylase [Paenibacillus darwinianus]EXX90949.1 lytic transglycosylase [Paenibacillus darwinianus]